jgi:hypothetical protein
MSPALVPPPLYMPGSLGNVFDVAAAVLAAGCADVLAVRGRGWAGGVPVAEHDDNKPCQPRPSLEQAPKLAEDLTLPVGMEHLALVTARVKPSR